jgi:Flp pilus assembly pilin Flp
MFRKLWNDDAGIVALEYMFVATIIGIGVTVGLENLRVGINIELSETAEAISGLNQGYFVGDQTGENGCTDASNVVDVASEDIAYNAGTAGSLTLNTTVDVTP